jgi:circadian clock protein KaiC
MLLVVKMRRSQHSIDMCEYQITTKGVIMGKPLRGYRALTSGIPGPWSAESVGTPGLATETPEQAKGTP